MLMATRPEIIIKLYHQAPKALCFNSSRQLTHKSCDVVIDRSSISLHVSFIRGHTAGSINIEWFQKLLKICVMNCYTMQSIQDQQLIKSDVKIDWSIGGGCLLSMIGACGKQTFMVNLRHPSKAIQKSQKVHCIL